jgi:hypothetical protein
VFGIRRSEHISDALISLHWLRVTERIRFKIAVMVYKPLHGSLPRCHDRLCPLFVQSLRGSGLRSAAFHRLRVPCCRLPCPVSLSSVPVHFWLRAPMFGCHLRTQPKCFPFLSQNVFVRFFLSWCSCFFVLSSHSIGVSYFRHVKSLCIIKSNKNSNKIIFSKCMSRKRPCPDNYLSAT